MRIQVAWIAEINIYRKRLKWDLFLSLWFPKYFLNCWSIERENTAELKTSKAWCSCRSSYKEAYIQTKCHFSRWTFAHAQAPS